jgi:superfamily II DNA or RNA helicase
MQNVEVQEELRAAIKQVLRSRSRKKLIIAGPGAGKTTLFRRLLETAPGGS